MFDDAGRYSSSWGSSSHEMAASVAHPQPLAASAVPTGATRRTGTTWPASSATRRRVPAIGAVAQTDAPHGAGVSDRPGLGDRQVYDQRCPVATAAAPSAGRSATCTSTTSHPRRCSAWTVRVGARRSASVDPAVRRGTLRGSPVDRPGWSEDAATSPRSRRLLSALIGVGARGWPHHPRRTRRGGDDPRSARRPPPLGPAAPTSSPASRSRALIARSWPARPLPGPSLPGASPGRVDGALPSGWGSPGRRQRTRPRARHDGPERPPVPSPPARRDLRRGWSADGSSVCPGSQPRSRPRPR